LPRFACFVFTAAAAGSCCYRDVQCVHAFRTEMAGLVDGLGDPVDGSWVAELEAAELALSNSDEDTSNNDDDGDSNSGRLLKAHLRVCRAYSTLRRWERLAAAAKRGLSLCRSLAGSNESAAGNDEVSAAAFREYRTRARHELSVETSLHRAGSEPLRGDDGVVRGAVDYDDYASYLRNACIKDGENPDWIINESSAYCNATAFQDAALRGDVRLMEAMVALGAAIDRPFALLPGRSGDATKVTVPPDASALLMACVVLAIANSHGVTLAAAKRAAPAYPPDQLDRMAECAMQLVRLGADLTVRLNVRDPRCSPLYRRMILVLDGRSVCELAPSTMRHELFALIREHVALTPEQRAEIVHCRCGSRLPWRKCHAAGIGQPPHYSTQQGSARPVVHYRLSPSARCPCNNSPTTYYRCCWKDNAAPAYRMDREAVNLHTRRPESVVPTPALRRQIESSYVEGHEDESAARVNDFLQGTDVVRESIRLFRESPSHFLEMCAEFGPKSNMAATWDAAVYAGCLENLDNPPFFWKDVHWDLDRTELLRRARDWNSALQKYCDEVGLQGEERNLVVKKHTAYPLRPVRICGLYRHRDSGSGVPALRGVPVDRVLRAQLPKQGLGGASQGVRIEPHDRGVCCRKRPLGRGPPIRIGATSW
jgi:hypothetical protein